MLTGISTNRASAETAYSVQPSSDFNRLELIAVDTVTGVSRVVSVIHDNMIANNISFSKPGDYFIPQQQAVLHRYEVNGQARLRTIDVNTGATITDVAAPDVPSDLQPIFSLQSGQSSDTETLLQDINSNKTEIARNREDIDKNSEGIAMAMAMSGLGSLEPDETFALSIDVGHFESESAAAVSGGLRLAQKTIISGSVGYGLKRDTVGGRAGIRFGW